MANDHEPDEPVTVAPPRKDGVRPGQLVLWIVVGVVGGIAMGFMVGGLGEAAGNTGQTLCVGFAIAVAFGFILGVVRRRR